MSATPGRYSIRPLLRHCGWPNASIEEVADTLGVPPATLRHQLAAGADRTSCLGFAHRISVPFDELWPTTPPEGVTGVTFSTRRACSLARVSYRQADYWVRTFAIAPTYSASGSGNRRLWTPDDVVRLATMGKLMAIANNATLVGAAIDGAWAENDGAAPQEVRVRSHDLPPGLEIVCQVPHFVDLIPRTEDASAP